MAQSRGAPYLSRMARQRRSDDWGFPRWRSYGSTRQAEAVRLCDRHGCDLPGDRPAPKSPNSPDRWYFCEAHAAEYNRNWNYFEGLTAEEAAMAKWWCTELQGRVIDAGVQLHGGYGYMLEYPIARAYADARVTRIYGGTTEIMKEIIGRSLGV